ncbi:MAG: MmgE/PrpD family protein [Rhodospirillaceae bacterium]|nr:MmgE/PrpD family protein [Rhodospirillaceae bacterium]
MSSSLVDKILAARTLQADAANAREVTRAYADTFAVIQAGWNEPVTRNMRKAYPDVQSPLLSSNTKVDAEHAALVWGAAAHALDYDDVHSTSVSHPSAVLVPAIEAAVRAENLPRDRVVNGYLLGLSVNIALGEALGYSHYEKGWHATSTVGPLAAAAAIAYIYNLDEAAFRHALSLAAAQGGGMQRNFGEHAKPVQAGLAASAGVRAARMAANGVTAAFDAFGEKGFLDLYAGKIPGRPVTDIVLTPDASTLSRKLYACCYMAHRPIMAALDARKKFDPKLLADPRVQVEVKVPFGGATALRHPVPTTGLEGKFSGPYAVAAALIDGRVNLGAFEDEHVRRADLQNLLRRTRLIEDPLDGDMPIGMDHGTVRLTVKRGDEILAFAEVTPFPGSPSSPITDAELDAKVRDCVAFEGGNSLSAEKLMAEAARCTPQH